MGSKKLVFKFLSVRSFVIAPARTGRLKTNKTVVIKTAQTKRGKFSQVLPGQRKLITVVIILIEPNKELIPAKCKDKIDKSTAAPK